MHKKQLPILLCFLAGLLPIIAFFFTAPQDSLQRSVDKVEGWMIVVSGFALLLGVVSVFQVNLKKISNRSQGWLNSVWLLASMVVMAFWGLLNAFDALPAFQDANVFGVTGQQGFTWIFNAAFQPLQSTMFSLLAFYVASAAFRAFRVRNVEAGLLLAAAMIIMLGVNPVTQGFLPFLSDWTNWILTVPNAAAQRGIIIGAALGAASMTLRILLGIERSWLGLQKGE
jgi:hypothetical protein